jgi:hypothetical protein
MVVMGSCHAVSGRLEVIGRAAKAIKALRSRACRRLYSEDTLLERLAQHFRHVPSALGAFIEEEHSVVGPRHLARPRHRPPPQAHIGDSVLGARNGRR